jgi:hypothetical protein
MCLAEKCETFRQHLFENFPSLLSVQLHELRFRRHFHTEVMDIFKVASCRVKFGPTMVLERTSLLYGLTLRMSRDAMLRHWH